MLRLLGTRLAAASVLRSISRWRGDNPTSGTRSLGFEDDPVHLSHGGESRIPMPARSPIAQQQAPSAVTLFGNMVERLKIEVGHSVYALTWSPDGTSLASATESFNSDDATIRIWRVPRTLS